MPDLPTIDQDRVDSRVGPLKSIYTAFNAYRSKKFLVFAIALGVLGFPAWELLQVAQDAPTMAESTNLYGFFAQVSIAYLIMQGLYDVMERYCQMRAQVAAIENPEPSEPEPTPTE